MVEYEGTSDHVSRASHLLSHLTRVKCHIQHPSQWNSAEMAPYGEPAIHVSISSLNHIEEF